MKLNSKSLENVSSVNKTNEHEKIFGYRYCKKNPVVITPRLADRNLCPNNLL
jgi:hypothetical protein